MPVLATAALMARATPDRAASLASMADAERAFAAAAASQGIRDAFVAFLDDNAIGFEPTPGNAKERWLKRPSSSPAQALLTWEPRTGDVAESGELGWLAGPYRLVQGKTAATRYGCYFSVWRRRGEGPWRVLIDAGVSTPEPCRFDAGPPTAAGVPSSQKKWPRDARASLLAADRALDADVARLGPAEAYRSRSAGTIRLHRDGRQPALGADAVAAALATTHGTWTFTVIDAETASSGDLGVTWGAYDRRRNVRSAEGGSYVRVWRRDARGAWQLTFDTLVPVE